MIGSGVFFLLCCSFHPGQISMAIANTKLLSAMLLNAIEVWWLSRPNPLLFSSFNSRSTIVAGQSITERPHISQSIHLRAAFSMARAAVLFFHFFFLRINIIKRLIIIMISLPGAQNCYQKFSNYITHHLNCLCIHFCSYWLCCFK